MNDDPRTDVVNRQYERWIYPPAIWDVGEWLRDNWQHYDPVCNSRIYWPDRAYRPDVDILVAGCGSNQGAVYAFTNPDARVVGIDISQASLDHEHYLKDRHGLQNLELHRLPIEELSTLGLDFDLIVSTGVLHHMADPLAGLKALASCLRCDGAIELMLYGKYGRAGVHVLQSVFRDLGLGQDHADIDLVRKTLSWLPSYHLVQAYLHQAWDVQYDAGLVDTFLHSREQSYTVDDCIDLVTSAGLVFQGWVNNRGYYPHPLAVPADDLYAAINALPEQKIWSVMDRLQTDQGCHSFIACRPDRAKGTYTIDFSTRNSLEYSPEWRSRCGLSGSALYRPDWRLDLDGTQLAFVQQVDGNRTIRDIVSTVTASATSPLRGFSEHEKYARKLFQGLWRLDFFAMAIDPNH